MSTKLIIDTGAWVAFLGIETSAQSDWVAGLIAREQALLCGVIKTELLQTAQDTATQMKLEQLFDHINTLPMDETLMLKAGIKMQQLRSNGIEVPVTSALIAEVAKENKVAVASADKSFAHLDVEWIDLTT